MIASQLSGNKAIDGDIDANDYGYGRALHAKEHPEDSDYKIDGVVANQCLMSTMAFAEGYYKSRAKRPVLRWLCGSR